MNTEKTDDDKLKANDGTTLDIAVGDDEALPAGLERMRSGVIAVTRIYLPIGLFLIFSKIERSTLAMNLPYGEIYLSFILNFLAILPIGKILAFWEISRSVSIAYLLFNRYNDGPGQRHL